jgi:hypothetical protein
VHVICCAENQKWHKRKNAKNRRTSLGLSPVRIFQFVGVLKDFCATFCATLGVGKPPVLGVRRNQAKIENRLVNKG